MLVSFRNQSVKFFRTLRFSSYVNFLLLRAKSFGVFDRTCCSGVWCSSVGVRVFVTIECVTVSRLRRGPTRLEQQRSHIYTLKYYALEHRYMTYLGVCCARGFTQSDSKNEHSSYHYLTFTFLNGAAYSHFGQDKMFEMFHSRSGKIETMSTRIRWVDSKTECYDILIPSMPAGITKKWHAFYDIFCGFNCRSFTICVFNPQYNLTIVFFCIEPIVQECSTATNMQIPSG